MFSTRRQLHPTVLRQEGSPRVSLRVCVQMYTHVNVSVWWLADIWCLEHRLGSGNLLSSFWFIRFFFVCFFSFSFLLLLFFSFFWYLWQVQFGLPKTEVKLESGGVSQEKRQRGMSVRQFALLFTGHIRITTLVMVMVVVVVKYWVRFPKTLLVGRSCSW